MKRLIRKIGLFCKKNSSLLLTGVSIAGVVSTTVIAFKSGMKAERKLDELKFEHFNKKEQPTKKEKAKLIAPEIAKTAIPSVLTVTTIVCLYLNDKKKEAALISAVAMVQQRYSNFRNHIREDDVEHINKDIAKEHKVKDGVFQTEINSGEPVLAYDEVSEKWFYTSLEDLKDEKYQINRYFAFADEISANLYLEFLGLPEEEWGDEIGWDRFIGETEYGYMWIDIDIIEEEMDDGLIYYRVHTPFGPHPIYTD